MNPFKFSRRTFLGMGLASVLPCRALPFRQVMRTPTAQQTPDLALYPLIYQRPGIVTDAAADSAAVQVVMVGDISMARGTAKAIADHGSDFDYPLREVAGWLHAADLAVGNQEGVIAADGVGVKRPFGYRLRADPLAAPALARAGFGLLGVANNHTLDFSPDGLRETVENLHSAGVQTVGAGQDYDSARIPLITTIRGVKVGWLAYVNVPDPPEYGFAYEGSFYGRCRLEEDKLIEQVRAARQLVDVLIVQIHWGVEYATKPFETQIRHAHKAIDAGASIVLGHHPHVVQTLETYNGKLIIYSLGNFLFDQEGRSGIAAWIRLDTQGVIDVHGIAVNPGVHPTWTAPARTAATLRDSCGTAESAVIFGFANDRYTKVEAVEGASAMLQATPRRSTLDMRGDGEEQRVTLENGTLRIFEDERIAYESHPSWQVVDYAVGDPNQDGRFEVLMLLWKQDTPESLVTTHPFLVGYRNGAYKVIWGGSPTPNWVQAVGIADVNGDSLDELITIERDPGATLCDPAYRVVIMNWNGWAFTRQWVSGPDAYRQLAFGEALAAPIVAGLFRPSINPKCASS